MNNINKNFSCFLIILTVLLTITRIGAQEIDFLFKINRVMDKVFSNQNFSESRFYEFLIDTNIVYLSAPENQRYPSIAFNGTNYLVVWTDERNDSSDIYGARVSQSGTVLDSVGIVISIAANNQRYPSISFDGINYLVAWQDKRSDAYSDIYGARVDQSGIVLDTLGIDISSDTLFQAYPSVAFDGNNYLTVWCDFRSDSDWDIYGARLNQSGAVLDPSGIILSTAVNSQYLPSVAFDGTNYLVVWEDLHSDSFSYDIYGMRINQSGVALDSFGIAISTMVNKQYNTSVAFGGINYLAVWEDARNVSSTSYDIYGSRVNQSGVVLDTIGISISATAYSENTPAVAFGAADYLVVWQDSRNITGYDIYGARVNQSGVVLDTIGIPVSTFFGYDGFPSVAFDGTNYLVAWQDCRDLPTAPDIYCARIDQSGIVLDPSGIAVSTVINDQRYPSVAFDGTNYFIVWQDYRNGNWDVYGARVDQSGVVLDTIGIIISTPVYEQGYPSVAFDGTNYIVVWMDGRGDPTDIYGAKVSTSGAVIDSFWVSLQPGIQSSPVLAHGIGDQLLITYSGWTDSINMAPVNTMHIWGKFYPFIGVEEEAESEISIRKINLQIYPNPVHKKCNIKYSLPQKTEVNISIYDVTGRLIKEIIYEPQNVGIYNKTFDVSDLSQGVYFIKLKTEEYSDTKKVIFIK